MDQVLVFRLGEESYALEVEHIQEVIEPSPMHYIPLAPAAFSGAINFHGSILPVLDLGASFGLPVAQRSGRYIVLAASFCSLALAVPAVQRIVWLDPGSLLPPEEDGRQAVFSRGVFDLDGDRVYLLDVAGLLASLDMTE